MAARTSPGSFDSAFAVRAERPCGSGMRKSSSRMARSTSVRCGARRPRTSTSSPTTIRRTSSRAFTFHGFRYAEVETDAELLDAELVAISCDTPRARHVRVLGAVAEPAARERRSGRFATTSSRCRPTARSATSGSAGRATPRRSPRRARSSWTPRRSGEAGCGTSRSSRTPSLGVPSVVPTSSSTGRWSTAGPDGRMPRRSCPGRSTTRTGTGGPRRQWASMRAGSIRSSARRGADGLLEPGPQFGDWLDPDAPPDRPWLAKADGDFLANAFFARSARLVADAADGLGEARRRPTARGSPTRWPALTWVAGRSMPGARRPAARSRSATGSSPRRSGERSRPRWHGRFARRTGGSRPGSSGRRSCCPRSRRRTILTRRISCSSGGGAVVALPGGPGRHDRLGAMGRDPPGRVDPSRDDAVHRGGRERAPRATCSRSTTTRTARSSSGSTATSAGICPRSSRLSADPLRPPAACAPVPSGCLDRDPYGRAAIEWRIDEAGSLVAEVSLPFGTTGIFSGALTDRSQVITDQRASTGDVDLAPGHHVILITEPRLAGATTASPAR